MAHGKQLEAPAGLKALGGQPTHASSCAYVPLGHGVQYVNGGAETWPDEHATHVAEPVPLANDPGVHGAQLVAPMLPANVPLGHSSHGAVVVSFLNVPGAHGKHSFVP
jgi:hypothetical protein